METIVHTTIQGYCHGLAASGLRRWQEHLENPMWACDYWHRNGDRYYRTHKSAWEDVLRVFTYPTRQVELMGTVCETPDTDNSVCVITVQRTWLGSFIWKTQNKKETQ